VQVDKDGIDFIKSLEEFSAKPYQDVAGHWTIGYGHTEGVSASSPFLTQDQAEKVLIEDLEEFENLVMELVSVQLTQSEFNALVSFTFNLGGWRLKKSTLLQKLNNGDKLGASKEFSRWCYYEDPGSGKMVVSTGLASRRAKEAALFISDFMNSRNSVRDA
jgi:lysozyme